MTGESDRDLPLHDEAKARAKWRGDETPFGKGGREAGPAAEGGESGASDPDGARPEDLAQRPPD